MKNKKYIFKAILITFILITLAACNKTQVNAKNDTEKENIDANYSMELYYPTKEYVVDGNEENKFFIEKLDIEDPHDIKEEIEKLKDISYIKDSEDEIYPAIPEEITINNISEENGKYTVDISSENLNGGSMEEDLLVSSIVNSILSIKDQNESYAKSVRFIIDGQPSSTLMGHVLIEEEFTEKI